MEWLAYNYLLDCAFQSCATYKPQYKTDIKSVFPTDKKILNTFYLIGDAGYASNNESTPGLIALKEHLGKAGIKDHVIFLGDNIYPDGLPKKKYGARELAEHRLDAQLDAVSGFNGKTIFIPGNHDWYANGLKGLKRQKDYIQKKLNDKDSFLPNNFCGLEELKISDKVHLVLIDSQWYLEDWDKHPVINDECDDIKTREQFFAAFEDLLSDEQDKTILVAMHHPVVTYGPHGGQLGFDKNIYPVGKTIPLPVLGTLASHIRKSGGVSIQDRINERYNQMANRLLTMARRGNKIIFASGHEHSLQYNQYEGIPVIVSGSGSKESATKLVTGAEFTYGKQGFARLDIFEDGSSWVRYFIDGSDVPVFQTEVYSPDPEPLVNELKEDFPKFEKKSIYNKSDTDKSVFYKGFWEINTAMFTVPT